jgi:hypothetical protein
MEFAMWLPGLKPAVAVRAGDRSATPEPAAAEKESEVAPV